MKIRILKDLLTFSIFISVVGCRENVDTSEEQCVQNLQALDAAARSYSLERNLNDSELIDPRDLTGFLKEGRVPKCPLGTVQYKSFTLSSGPSCPNKPAHTAKFKKGRPQLEKRLEK